jgi:hypothetical protein
MSITDHVIQCFNLFKESESNFEIYGGSGTDPGVSLILEDASARFNIWKNNIGAHRKGQASLDYRLRDASNLHKTVVDLLQEISSALRDVNEIIVGETVPWDQKDPTPDVEEADPDEPQSELSEILNYVVDSVKCLLRLSISIKHPAPHDRFLRSANIDTSHYEQFDINHVTSKFPSSPKFLAERLGKANSKRRLYLKYREQHRQRLEKDQGPDNQTVASSLPSGIHQKAVDLKDNIVEPHIPDDISMTSYAKTEASPDMALVVPKMPVEANNGEEFECPFCYTIVSVSNRREWK